MKTLTTKKLFAFIVTVMMFSFNDVVAQIIETDFDPGITKNCPGPNLYYNGVCSDFYELDLNNDGIMDFSLFTRASSNGCSRFNGGNFQTINAYINVTPLNANAVSGLKLALNAVIDGNTSWSTTVQDLRRSTVQDDCSVNYSAAWSDTTDGYLALKLTVNNEVYFGWARLSISGPPYGFTIKGYAYNSTPNQAIAAGNNQVLSTDNFARNTNFRVYPNPFSDATNIAFTLDQSEKVSMRIIDINGRLIKNLVNSYLDAGDHLIQCNTENLNCGIYFLQIQAGETLTTEKLMVTK